MLTLLFGCVIIVPDSIAEQRELRSNAKEGAEAEKMIAWEKKESRCLSTLGCHERTLGEILGLCRKYGIGKLEIRGIGGELDNRRIPELGDAEIAETAAKMTDAGVSPYIIGTSCKYDTDETAAKSFAEGTFSLDAAKKLGCFGIRIFGNKIIGDTSSAAARLSRGIADLCAYAADNSVLVLLETHGDFTSPATLAPIAERVGDLPNFGLIWDIAHTNVQNGGNWISFYNEFRPLIRHVHIKDSADGKLCLPGCGRLLIDEICSHMLQDGFNGAFSLEWERKWHPELPPVESAIEKLMNQPQRETGAGNDSGMPAFPGRSES